MLGHLELHGLFAPGLADGSGNPLNGLGRGIGHFGDGGGVALGLVDRGLLFTLRAGNEGFALPRGDVDLLLTAAFRSRDQRTLFALGRDL